MNNMSIKKGLFGTVGLSLLAIGLQLPAAAQTTVVAEPAEAIMIHETELADEALTPTSNAIADLTVDEPQVQLADLTASLVAPQVLDQADILVEIPELEAVPAADLLLPTEDLIALESTAVEPMQPVTEAAELAYPAVEAPEELAQIRRRTRGGAASGANFIGIGADFGFADDVSFAAISKFSFSEKWAVRPTVLLGDDFSVLVPVTYDFSRFGSAVGGFPILPYAGAGASFSDSDDSDSDINLLLSAGIDVPVSDRFTVNAQVNWGVLNDSQFGATVGVGYNLGNIFQ